MYYRECSGRSTGCSATSMVYFRSQLSLRERHILEGEPTWACVGGLLPLTPFKPLELAPGLLLRKREGSKRGVSAAAPWT